ncbi:hypothetical protein BH20VER1_BH20VER1_08240 [soil metagenome]
MSLTELQRAVDSLPPKELAQLAGYIARQDKLAWDQELEQDFAPSGRLKALLLRVDAQIDAGEGTPLP